MAEGRHPARKQASRKLYLAQPSVSLAIKELEDAYHIRLFDRISRRRFIIERGEAFYDYASLIIKMFDEMESNMASPDMPLGISIGSSIIIGNHFVPGLVSKFHDVYPTCEVKVTIQNSRQIVKSVLKNELDLGFVEDKVQDEQLKGAVGK